MPTNRPSTPALSAHVARLAIDIQRAVDQLLAQPMNDVEADQNLNPSAVLLSGVLDQLTDAIYRAEELDQSHRARDLAMARLLAGLAEATDPLALA